MHHTYRGWCSFLPAVAGCGPNGWGKGWATLSLLSLPLPSGQSQPVESWCIQWTPAADTCTEELRNIWRLWGTSVPDTCTQELYNTWRLWGASAADTCTQEFHNTWRFGKKYDILLWYNSRGQPSSTKKIVTHYDKKLYKKGQIAICPVWQVSRLWPLSCCVWQASRLCPASCRVWLVSRWCPTSFCVVQVSRLSPGSWCVWQASRLCPASCCMWQASRLCPASCHMW